MEIELTGRLIQQEDGEDLVVDQVFDQRRGFRQHIVQVERGVDLFADFGERGQCLGGEFDLRVGLDGIHGNARQQETRKTRVGKKQTIIAGAFDGPVNCRSEM